MQYELRYQVVEPRRNTFQNLIDRFGDKPASRYQEGTVDVQPTEHFHYRPTWAPDKQIYDPSFSALRLADPYSFADPRQFYYTPYVTTRAAAQDAFGQTLRYLDERGILPRLPQRWLTLLVSTAVALRHYESGAGLISVAGARFADGTSVEQCCSFAAFDRTGNAQMLSRLGLALRGAGSDGDGAGLLADARTAWTDAPHLQPLRRLIEEALVEPDWAVGVLAVDLADGYLYPLLYEALDDVALTDGAAGYSLVGQHFRTWYADQRRWLDALIKAWLADTEHGAANGSLLVDAYQRWSPPARTAATALAAEIDAALPDAGLADRVADVDEAQHRRWRDLGVPLAGGPERGAAGQGAVGDGSATGVSTRQPGGAA